MNSKNLHLCDFDGTLTRGDSLLGFLLFAVPVPQLAWGSFLLIFRLLGLVFSGNWSNASGKAAVLSEFFKGKSAVEMRELGKAFYQKKISGMLRLELLEPLRQARLAGDTVVVVSASPDLWLQPFCTAEDFDLLCTALEFEADIFTGRFATPNCNGTEKARRIQAAYDLRVFEKISAYGNSKGDTAMYALADAVFKF